MKKLFLSLLLFCGIISQNNLLVAMQRRSYYNAKGHPKFGCRSLPTIKPMPTHYFDALSDDDNGVAEETGRPTPQKTVSSIVAQPAQHQFDAAVAHNKFMKTRRHLEELRRLQMMQMDGSTPMSPGAPALPGPDGVFFGGATLQPDHEDFVPMMEVTQFIRALLPTINEEALYCFDPSRSAFEDEDATMRDNEDR